MKIFVEIASYRDRELVKTIEDCLEKASNSHELSFGICNQCQIVDVEDQLKKYRSDCRFKIIDVDFKESKGVCWARSKTLALLEDEDYVLQIDSHMRFAEQWDELLIDMLHRAPASKPVITCYPPPYCVETGKKKDVFWEMIPTRHGGMNGNVRYNSRERADRKLREHCGFGAGFVFCRTGAFVDVPYDPELYFQGEEISMALRLWTSGYTLFLPDVNTVWHNYVSTTNNSGRRKHWADHTARSDTDYSFAKLNSFSISKVRKLCLGESVDFGVGDVRTIDEFENYFGISFKEKFVSEKVGKSNDLPIYTDSAWKHVKKKRYSILLDWSQIMDELRKDPPDVIAVMCGERRKDVIFRDDMESRITIQIRRAAPPEKFVAWVYNKNPLNWGKRYELPSSIVSSC